MQQLGNIQGPVPGLCSPDSGYAATLELHLPFSRPRSEWSIMVAGVPPGARACLFQCHVVLGCLSLLKDLQRWRDYHLPRQTLPPPNRSCLHIRVFLNPNLPCNLSSGPTLQSDWEQIHCIFHRTACQIFVDRYHIVSSQSLLQAKYAQPLQFFPMGTMKNDKKQWL